MQDTELTLREALAFARDAAQKEADEFDGDVPKHSTSVIVGRAADLLQTEANIDVAQSADDIDGPGEDHIKNSIEEDVVDLLLAVGGLLTEYDIDIAAAFEDRMQLIRDYRKLIDAVEEADGREEQVDAVEEHITEDIKEMMGLDGLVDAGTNVDAENYDHEDIEKSFQ